MTASIEIERKFLVLKKPDQKPEKIINIKQGYIARDNGNTVRIREKNGVYILSIKTDHPSGGRNELEYEVTEQEADILFASIPHVPIIKKRYIYVENGQTWELDIFEGENQGLLIAEAELPSFEAELNLPEWVGPEVTEYGKFYNAALSERPFSSWYTTYEALLDRMTAA